MFDPIDDKTIQYEPFTIALFVPLAAGVLLFYVAYLAAGAIGIFAVLSFAFHLIMN